MGIFIYGKRGYGRVERCHGTCVLTTFAHVWFLPIVPQGSYVLSDGKALPIGNHWGSIVAGYLRTWGVVWLLGCLVAVAQGAHEFVIAGVPVWVDAIVLAALVLASWRWIGRLSPAEAAQRATYARFTGIPVDAGRLSRAQCVGVRERVDQVLTAEGRALATLYRDGADPCASWRDVALHPAVSSAPYLEAALTRARLEVAVARRSERAELRDAHERIWQKLEERSSSPSELLF